MACLRLLCVSTISWMAACGGQGSKEPPQEAGKALYLYTWSDYLAPDTISDFEKKSGIQVSVTYFGSNEELDAKLAAGHTGYDLVVPSANFAERQIRSGYHRKLDKAKLPNLSNLDPQMQALMARFDPGNEHAVIYLWGVTGIAYDPEKVKARAPDAPLNSWRLVFDPDVARRLHGCGIALLESPVEMIKAALDFIGKDPNSENPADIEAAAEALMKIRPYIRSADSVRMLSDLANGETCVAVAYSGVYRQANDRIKETGQPRTVGFFVPKEGSLLWMDTLVIPADAPNPENAHAFLNYILEPQVMAAVTNLTKFANANLPAKAFVRPDILGDAGIYPSADVRARLEPDRAPGESTVRLMTRLWTKFMSGT